VTRRHTYTGYDAHILQGPPEYDPPGNEVGETCNRYPEPDEDAPRGWRPTPCSGSMVDDDGYVICDTCGEMA
jgi:hypothetical protein